MSFVTDGSGTVLQRDEQDYNTNGTVNTTTGDPRELYFYFAGTRVGDVSNNGTSDTDYVVSLGAHLSQGTGGFRGGATTGVAYADFDQAYEPINGLNYDATSSRYTVQSGDTLQSIAQTVWGDSSLWYMIADANGLDGSETLAAGRDLIIPNKVHNAHNTSDVYRVYDPNEAIGNNNPTTPKPQAAASHHHGCGVFGQILLIAIAVAVTVISSGAAAAAIVGEGGIGSGLGAIAAGSIAGPLSSGALIAIGAGSAALGSVVSQGIGVATGLQDRFSFAGVALAAISGGVGAGLGEIPGLSGARGFGGVLQGIARGALGNVATQGIALATGLQHNFDWTGVAVGGAVGGAVSGVHVAGLGGYAGLLVGGLAGAVAGGAARSLIDGSDFGDNIMSALPEVVGSTIGELVGGSLAIRDDPRAQVAASNGVTSDRRVWPAAYHEGQDGAPPPKDYGEIVVTASRSLWSEIKGLWHTIESGAEAAWSDIQQNSLVGRLTMAIAPSGGWAGGGFTGSGGGSFGGGGTTGYWGASSKPITSHAVANTVAARQSTMGVHASIGNEGLSAEIVGLGGSTAVSITNGGVAITLGANGGQSVNLSISNAGISLSGSAPSGSVGLSLSAAEGAGARFGTSTSNNYRATFFAANPGLEGQVVVHHAVEQRVLIKFPDVVTQSEVHSLENLRGIPNTVNSDLHLSIIRIEWNNFYKPFEATGTAPSQAQLLQKATEIDAKYGTQFNPPH